LENRLEIKIERFRASEISFQENIIISGAIVNSSYFNFEKKNEVAISLNCPFNQEWIQKLDWTALVRRAGDIESDCWWQLSQTDQQYFANIKILCFCVIK